MPTFFKIEYGGEAPFFSRIETMGKYAQCRKAFNKLAIPENDEYSHWMQIRNLEDKHVAQRIQAAIGRHARVCEPNRNWGYETHVLHEEDGTVTLWVRKGLPLLAFNQRTRHARPAVPANRNGSSRKKMSISEVREGPVLVVSQ